MGDLINLREPAIDTRIRPISEDRSPIPRGWIILGAAIACWALGIGIVLGIIYVGGVIL